MENMYLDDFIELQQNGFKEKMNSYGYYAVDGGQTKVLYEHATNKSKIIFTLKYDNKDEKNYELFVDFINDKNEKYSGNSWYLGNQDRLVIDDIFNIISTSNYINFTEIKANDFKNVRIHKGSDNWKVEKLEKLKTNLKSVLLSYDKDFFDVMNTLDFGFISENLDRLIFAHKKSRTELVIRQYDRCIFYNFIRNEKDMFYNNGFGKFFGLTEKIEIEELYRLIKTRDFEIFLYKDIENYNKQDEKLSKDFYAIYTGGITQTQVEIGRICAEISNLLIYKNKKYGNSAIEPINIFYKGNNENSILIRLDDKLSRIKNNKEDIRVNDICDTIGYLVLLLISKGVEPEQIEKLKD